MPSIHRLVQISTEGGPIFGDLILPLRTRALILFAHGSGSSRLSRRNQYVAQGLNRASFGTLLIDLLTAKEELVDQRTRNMRFDIPFLANRLSYSIEWLHRFEETANLKLGIFGASTGSAAAIVAASENQGDIGAVVSRGGRPDLAGRYLRQLKSPTMLIVGGADTAVLDLNQIAMHEMTCVKRLEVVESATHLFEEPGALDQVAHLSVAWFSRYLKSPLAMASSQ